MAKFIDEAVILTASGHGGPGAVSFRREKHIPRGGPDGGNGGRGAHVILKGDKRLASLMDFRYKKQYLAPRGAHGEGKNKSGKDGEDLILRLPLGTIVKDEETGEILIDITEDGTEYTCLKGGRGGKGNTFFKTSTNQAPQHAQDGEDGEELELKLELKLLADVGIIGYPNAGKSTLISRISAAKPKIADYPFTTLIPNLGVVEFGDFDFVVADIPGLIEGASTGKGLGFQFLKHIERTKLFIHMIDLSPATGRDPKEDFKVINGELKNFNEELSHRQQVIALNKSDVVGEEEDLAELKKYFEGTGLRVFVISSATGLGLGDLVNYVGKLVIDEKSKSSEVVEDFYGPVEKSSKIVVKEN